MTDDNQDSNGSDEDTTPIIPPMLFEITFRIDLNDTDIQQLLAGNNVLVSGMASSEGDQPDIDMKVIVGYVRGTRPQNFIYGGTNEVH